MVNIITKDTLIDRYQKQFIKQLKTSCTEPITCKVGYKGGSALMSVFYSKKHNFWFTSQEETNRYWNAFGFGYPQTRKNNSITVEINIPYMGVNRRIAGAFALNNVSEVIVLHRGKIGGGKNGIGKQLFSSQYTGSSLTAFSDNTEDTFYIIDKIYSSSLAKNIGSFVSAVYQMKTLAKERAHNSASLNNYLHTEESTGTSDVTRTSSTTMERTHGIVVNTLMKILRKKGYQVDRDINRDLFIHVKGKIKTLFEVKRSSSTYDMYCAVGQLMIHSPIETAVNLTIVLPEKLSVPNEQKLHQLGIRPLYYDWNNGKPIFHSLEHIL